MEMIQIFKKFYIDYFGMQSGNGVVTLSLYAH
jgi:hypothetical protein